MHLGPSQIYTVIYCDVFKARPPKDCQIRCIKFVHVDFPYKKISSNRRSFKVNLGSPLSGPTRWAQFLIAAQSQFIEVRLFKSNWAIELQVCELGQSTGFYVVETCLLTVCVHMEASRIDRPRYLYCGKID